MEEAYKRTLALIRFRQPEVVKVAQLLLERETITHGDVAELIGARAFSAGAEYEAYLTHTKKQRQCPLGPVIEAVVEAVTAGGKGDSEGGEGGVTVGLA